MPTAVKTSPANEIAVAAPTASEIDIAALLPPWSRSVEAASTRAETRGYISPIPAPASTQAAPINHGESCSTVATSSPATPPSSSTAPIRTAARWSSRAPSEAWTWEAAGPAERPDGQRRRPDSQADRPYCSWSR